MLWIKHILRRCTGGYKQCPAFKQTKKSKKADGENKAVKGYSHYCQLDEGHRGQHVSASGKRF